MGEDIYIPVTVNELIKSLQNVVNGDVLLTGEELVIGADYVYGEDESNLPPCTILFRIARGTKDPEETEKGVITVSPRRVTRVM